LLAIVAVTALAGCNPENELAALPGPVAMTEESVGHYCNMNILEHTGPKAQIHLKNIEAPIWFSQVRDAIAFLRSPEETQVSVAVYVNDMGKATNWDAPGDDTWINIDTAYFVTDSGRAGGMGAPEAIPFGSRDDAKEFAAEYGGAVMRLQEIPDEYVLGPVDLKPQTPALPGTI
jgi:copper chaperone NosL